MGHNRINCQMKNVKSEVSIAIRCSSELRDAVREMAEEFGISANQYVCEALREMLESDQKALDAEAGVQSGKT